MSTKLEKQKQREYHKKWDLFHRLEDGEPVGLRKYGEWMEFGFVYRGKWICLWGLTEALPGEGLMEWKAYKERTEKM